MLNEIEKYRNYYSGKRVMVSGGLGFLGSNLIDALVTMNSRVLIVDALLEPYGGNLFNVEHIREKVDIDFSDIRDCEAMTGLVKGQDIIFNLAAQVSHIDSMKDPMEDYQINIRGNLSILEACRRANPDVKIVYAGTRGQYGKLDSLPISENRERKPLDIYGVHKDTGERYHFIYSQLYGLRSTSLRINNTYGPRHQMKHGKYGILNWFIRLALDDQTIRVYGDGSQLRDYNYVDDVTAAFLIAGAEESVNGEAFNLGSGTPVEFLSMVKLIIKLAGSGKFELVPWTNERKRIEVGDYLADFTKIEKSAGWKPCVKIEEGLAVTIDYYRRYREHYWNRQSQN